MMDPSLGWIQPEFEGPALELWLKCWKDFNQMDDKSSTNYLKDNPSSTHDLDNNPHLISKYKGTPWIKSKDCHYEGLVGLNQEIEDFYEYMKPKVREQQIRNEVLNRITGLIENMWPNTLVSCFGSFKTDTYLPTSDIDLVVINHQWPYLPLIEMEEYLIYSGQCHPTQIRVLDRASVPIIKMIDYFSGIRINISFNMPQVVKSVALVNEYLKEFPNAIKLLFLIKQFVLQRDLNEVFKGGLSSYSLLLMVVHFFKANPETHTDSDKSELGYVLMRFLELYGRKLNYEEVGLNVKDGVYCKKSELFVNIKNGHDSRHPPSLLWIEDPLDLTNNVSKNSYKANQIRDAFSYAFDTLERVVGPTEKIVQKTDTILGRIVRITDEVIDKRKALLNNYRNPYRIIPSHGNSYNRTDHFPYRQHRGGHRGHRGNRGNRGQSNNVQSHQCVLQNGSQQHNGFQFCENSQQLQRNQRFDNRNKSGIKRNNPQNVHYPHSPHSQKFRNSYQQSPNNVCYYSFDRNPNQQKERALQLTDKTPVIGRSDKSVPNDSTDKESNPRLRSNTCD